jgi:hypothetical protein
LPQSADRARVNSVISTIAAAKSRAIQSGVASGDEIDALERALRAAKDGGYDWVTTPFFLALTLRHAYARRGFRPAASAP